MNRTEDDLGVVSHRFVDNLVDLMHFAEREVGAAGDIHQHAGRGPVLRRVGRHHLGPRGDGLAGI